jgi:hypothetical protein
MVDRNAMVVASDPIGYSSPLAGCIRVLRACVCFEVHVGCSLTMCEFIETENIIAEKFAIDSIQTATCW